MPELIPFDSIPREPGAPGTLWRDGADRIRPVLPERERATALPPLVAGRTFVAWLQDWGFAGERVWGGPNGIWEYYLWHCRDAGLRPLDRWQLGAALGQLGIERRETHRRLPGNRRERLTVYSIPEALPEMAEAKRKPRRADAPAAMWAAEGARKSAA